MQSCIGEPVKIVRQLFSWPNTVQLGLAIVRLAVKFHETARIAVRPRPTFEVVGFKPALKLDGLT